MNDIPNSLIHETSPYLLQHAYNPVRWYPWGEEAFQLAQDQDKPVFLSIGYSTCHWCHVMERESFEDPEVAALMNESFVAVKVDREERPDIDTIYMTVCQAMTGSGGWPLTVFLTPDKKPFFTGTYFPKHQRYGQTGLLELLPAIAEKWSTQKNQLIESGNKISRDIAKQAQTRAKHGGTLDLQPAIAAYHTLAQEFDQEYGGFGNAPKFPAPHNLMFLLHANYAGFGTEALEMTDHTLQSMYRGGLFDHAGFGFSRYSTDPFWLVPHFEKMLYDNALLAIAYTEGYQAVKKPLYRYIAEQTLLYVQREMTDSAGGFYSAQDADSEGEEGKYYTWSYDEIHALLGPADAMHFCSLYGVTKEGNFEQKNILNRLKHGTDEIPDQRTAKMLDILYKARPDRYPLHKDDKILTSWNALMIAAYARAGRVFQNQSYLNTANQALSFINQHLTYPDGRLKVSYRNGVSHGTGTLDDYAFLCWACLELYESTQAPLVLGQAISLAETTIEKFGSRDGGCYFSAVDAEDLLYRPMEFYDGAVPSGNSVFAYCLVILSGLTGDPKWERHATRQLQAFGQMFDVYPAASTFGLKAVLSLLTPSIELVCITDQEEDASLLRKELSGRFLPGLSFHIITNDNYTQLQTLVPFLAQYPVPGPTAYYLCQGGSCFAPFSALSEAMDTLDRLTVQLNALK